MCDVYIEKQNGGSHIKKNCIVEVFHVVMHVAECNRMLKSILDR